MTWVKLGSLGPQGGGRQAAQNFRGGTEKRKVDYNFYPLLVEIYAPPPTHTRAHAYIYIYIYIFFIYVIYLFVFS